MRPNSSGLSQSANNDYFYENSDTEIIIADKDVFLNNVVVCLFSAWKCGLSTYTNHGKLQNQKIKIFALLVVKQDNYKN